MPLLLTLLLLPLKKIIYDENLHYYNHNTARFQYVSTITTLYEVICGEPGAQRDWARFKNLFKSEGRLIPTRKVENGNLIIKALTPDEYIELFAPRIPVGFYERELNRKVEEFGTVAHAFSTYETRDKKDGPVTNRGINSIQLFKDNDRYYIVNVYWCAESMGFELPKKYLSSKK